MSDNPPDNPGGLSRLRPQAARWRPSEPGTGRPAPRSWAEPQADGGALGRGAGRRPARDRAEPQADGGALGRGARGGARTGLAARGGAGRGNRGRRWCRQSSNRSGGNRGRLGRGIEPPAGGNPRPGGAGRGPLPQVPDVWQIVIGFDNVPNMSHDGVSSNTTHRTTERRRWAFTSSRSRLRWWFRRW